MTLSEQKRWMDGHSVNDKWCVAIDGDVQDHLLSLSDISKLKDQYSTGQISVLHETKAGEKEAEWMPLEVEISQGLAESIQSVLCDVRSEVENLKAELTALRDLVEMLKQPLMEANLVLAERESFLEDDEESPLEMSEGQTVQENELVQMREELEAATQAPSASNNLLIAI